MRIAADLFKPTREKEREREEGDNPAQCLWHLVALPV